MAHKSADAVSRTKREFNGMNQPAVPASLWKSPGQFPLRVAACGALLYFAALPPLAWAPLGFLAPIPWLMLIRDPVRLPGKKYYVRLWLAGVLFWLLAVHWLRLPHWATSFGWIALALYLGAYLPVFVGLSRVAVHRFQIPLLIAAPIIWVGLEWARAHLITGFLMAALGHTQVGWIEFLQIADLAGGYTVCFVMILLAACVARMLPVAETRRTFWPLAPLLAVLAAALLYGRHRIANAPQHPGPHVALIQGSIDADWKQDPGKDVRINATYFDLSRQAIAASAQPVDLVVWPETMYRRPLLVLDEDLGTSPDVPYSRADLERAAGDFSQEVFAMAGMLDAPLLLGVEALHFQQLDQPLRYNSAIAIEPGGAMSQRYDKNHRVLFGEYIPLGEAFPAIYQLSPIGSGLQAGASAESFSIRGVRYAPNVCYESVLPQVIAHQVRALTSVGESPDVLVNLTNDAWFWGSSELDMHLACDVFRAIECRRPMLVAANGGLTAVVDASGRVLAKLPRRTDRFLLADVPLDGRESLYLTVGDWPVAACLLACVLLGLGGLTPLIRNGKNADS
ncbi:MAG: apolipoprotein N-acyltransferase [Planctomycetales bacterium]|nr:apolipoprotein N-acyltransferase [Planctomycetales bacterium]